MYMSPSKLVILRCFNVSLGRFELFSKLFRQVLLKSIRTKKAGMTYVASSKYFDFRELEIEKGNGSEPVE